MFSGIAALCAQKNHNLLAGLRSLKPDTEILVFCDSTNMADPGWLGRFTKPLRNGDCQVVTTFRAFRPDPETLGGVCQAIYASFIRLLAAIKPTPWGGATAIRRETFERLNVAEAWSRTVVDDLILGNAFGSCRSKGADRFPQLTQIPFARTVRQGILGLFGSSGSFFPSLPIRGFGRRRLCSIST